MSGPIASLTAIHRERASDLPTALEIDSPAQSHMVKPGEVPPGLDAKSWTSIQAQIERSRYRLEHGAKGVEGANPEQGWKLEFDSRGLSLDPDPAKSDVGRFKPEAEPTSGPSSIVRVSANHLSSAPVGSAREKHAGLTQPTPATPAGTTRSAGEVSDRLPNANDKPRIASGLRLSTTAIGRASGMHAVTATAPRAYENRVELVHSQAIEWYTNSALGLEHGYTFEHAPQGERGEVRIHLAVEGGLKVQVDANGVMLTDAAGKPRLRYHKLQVLDARGRELDARLDVHDKTGLLIAFDDRTARYPVVVDPLLVNEEAKLTAADAAEGDALGSSVAVSGDTVVVGAPGDDGDLGSAYVFVRSGTNWSQQAKLTAADVRTRANFAGSVAVFGDTAVVGAQNDRLGFDDPRGSAYVFVRNGTTWTQQAKLTAADGGDLDDFGKSVAVSGDTMLIGARRHSTVSDCCEGAAYIFVRSGTDWSLQAKLIDPVSSTYDFFGTSVALVGDTAVVGTPGDDHDRGSAYVFVRTGSDWSQQAKLTAADGVDYDGFGGSVALSGDAVVVGASHTNIDGDQGAAYLFVRSGSTWSQGAKLTPTPGEADAGFGRSVALSGNTAVVGAFRDDVGPNTDQGAAYLFVRSGDTWSQQARLAAAVGKAEDLFGISVALSGDTALVGAFVDDSGSASGAAYIYRIVSDYGDAPDPTYSTLIANDGARHLVTPAGPRLGIALDADPDGQPASGAVGDDIAGSDDEDGVEFAPELRAGETGTVDLDVTGGPGLLDAWIDFNGDGDWDDADERIAEQIIVMPGDNTVAFTVPADAAAGTTFSRFRLSTDGVEAPTGPAPDGEVEDHQLNIESPDAGEDDASPDAFAFQSVSEVEPDSVQTSEMILVSGIDVEVGISVEHGEYSINGGGFTPTPGRVSAGDRVSVQHVADHGFANSVTTTLFIGTASGTFTSTTVARDGIPETFEFTDEFNVETITEQVSNVIVVSGINTLVPVSVINGEYSVNGLPYTRFDGEVGEGALIRVRHVSSASFETATDTVLTIGVDGVLLGVSDTFTTVTEPRDTTPDAFAFDSRDGVTSSTQQISNAIFVAGINSPAVISINGGQYSINRGTFRTAPANVRDGDEVRVRHTSASTAVGTVTTTLVIGGVGATFSTTTADTEPDAFAFTSVTNVPRSSVQTSNTITVSGISGAASITVVGGSYSVNGAAFRTTASSVNAGASVRVRHTASASFSSTVTTSLSIGGVSASFSSTTLPEDTEPNPFSFAPETGVALSTTQTSATVTISGINARAPISVAGGSYSINNGAFRSTAATVGSGDRIRLRHTSSAAFSTTVTTTITVGSFSTAFRSTTAAPDTTPNAFTFTNRRGAVVGTRYTSDTVTISGINAPATVSISGLSEPAYSINGAAFTSASRTVRNGDQLRVRNRIPSGRTSVNTTLTVGGVADTWTISTAP